jgi:uncharacterized protein (TIGR03083 family)
MDQLIPREQAMDLFRRSTAQVQRHMRYLAGQSDRAIPHMEWTVGELSAHLVQGAQIANELVDGKPSPFERFDRISETNERLLREKPERDLNVLLSEYIAAVESLDRKIANLPDDARVPFHQGWSFTPAEAMAMMSAEHLIHAWDLSNVTGRPLEINPADARLIVYVMASLLPVVVDREAAQGLTATYEIRIRDGATFRLHFEDGEPNVSAVEPGGPADVVMSVDACAFLLTGYGRGSQIKPMLTGKMLTWGRKPWLAAQFTKLVKTP